MSEVSFSIFASSALQPPSQVSPSLHSALALRTEQEVPQRRTGELMRALGSRVLIEATSTLNPGGLAARARAMARSSSEESKEAHNGNDV